MAVSPARLIQDENLDILFTGPILGEKTDGSKAQKKGGSITGFGLADVFTFPRGEILGEKIDGFKSQKKGGGEILGEKTDGFKAQKKGRSLQDNQESVEELRNIIVQLVGLDEIRQPHNHEECIKDQMAESMRLDDGPLFPLLALELRSPPPPPSISDLLEKLIDILL